MHKLILSLGAAALLLSWHADAQNSGFQAGTDLAPAYNASFPPQSISLVAHDKVPNGQRVVSASIDTATLATKGVVTAPNSKFAVTYQPGAAFATLAKGQTGHDSFGFCLTSSANKVSCSTVKVTVFGTYVAPPVVVPPPVVTPPVVTPPAAAAAYTCKRNWYVAATGKDNAAGTQDAPWLTLQHANDSGTLQAGDCVNVAAGSYALTGTATLGIGGNANSPTGYIVYRSSVPGGAVLKAKTAGMYDAVQATGNYMIFDGFEIDGGNTGLTKNPITAGHCLEGTGHHFQALNNLIHDCGGAGISAQHQDWYTFTGNTVHDTSKFNGYQTSGISIYEPRAASYTATAADTSAAYHIVVSHNVSHDNAETYVSGQHTDGNGIIMDDFQGTQNTPHTIYPYKSLVQGNTSYNNGGKGIHVFVSNYITLDGNVAYNNDNDTGNPGTYRAELSNQAGVGNTWTNNRAYLVSAASGLLSNNAAVLDAGDGVTPNNTVWQNNATLDGRTGKQGLNMDSTAIQTKYLLPASNNTLGAKLP